eukprot:TRINITY_DN1519_c0_g2_i9.p1 TRINITY_DN1519_c0_g2~~TRINITY_DN1519_c0_g2_i9.p1  ORF type:complete len:1541 (+),score=331.67 TRINITY_DN1519_c0_g2_i9:64-4686(+)
MGELLHLMVSTLRAVVFLAVDIACVAILSCTAVSGIRTFPTIRTLSHIKDREMLREAALMQLLMLICDVGCMVSFFASFALAPWRIPDALRAYFAAFSLGPEHVSNCGFQEANMEIRAVTFVQGFIAIAEWFTVPAGVVALLLPWRTYSAAKAYGYAMKEYEKEDEKKFFYNSNLRYAFLTQGLLALIDIPFLIMGFFSIMIPWRTVSIIQSLMKVDNDLVKEETQWNWKVRKMAFYQFIFSGIDFVAIVPTLLMILTVFRVPALWKKLKNVEEHRYDKGFNITFQKRIVIFNELGIWCLDVFFIPIVLFLLMTWRAPKILEILKDKECDFLRKRFRCIYQLGYLMLDLPFAVLAVFVALTLWRLPALYRDFKKAEKASQYRRACWYQALMFLRDIFVFILFFMNCVFLYPIPGMIAKMITLSKQPKLGDEPELSVDKYRIESCAEGGYRFHIQGNKKQGFSFRSAKIYILGNNLWQTSTDICGAGKIFVGKSMLPMELVPDCLDVADFPQDATQYSTTIRFGIGNVRLTKRVLSRFMDKLKARRSDIDIHIHVEYNNQQGTLFDIHLTPQDIITSLESSEMMDAPQIDANAPKEETKVLQYHEIFFSVVVEYTLLLLRDIACLLGLVRLMFQPHKLVETIVLTFESPDRQKARKAARSISILKRLYADMEILEKRKDDAMELSINNRWSRDYSRGFIGRAKVEEDDFMGRKIKLLYKTHQEMKTINTSYEAQIVDIEKKTEDLQQLRYDIVGLNYDIITNKATSPDPDLDMHNLRVAHADAHRLLKDACDNLSHSKVDIPSFWSNASRKHRSWSDKCGMVFGMVVDATHDAVALFVLLLLAVTVVRFIPALMDIRKNPFIWRVVCYRHILELLKDIGHLLMLLVVVALIRHSLSIVFDVATDVYVKRNVKSARKTIQYRFERTFEDLAYLLSFVTAWKTYRFLLAICVWGLLGPADTFSELFSHLNVPKNVRKPLSIVLWFAAIIFPVVFVFHIMSTTDDDYGSYDGWMKAFLIYVACLLLPLIFYSAKEKAVLEKDDDSVEYHFNVYNNIAAFHLLVEAYQNLSVTWQFDNTAVDDVSAPAFLAFDEWWEISFWIAMGIVGMWFFFSSAPTVVEEMLGWKSQGYFAQNPLWGSILFFCGRTMMLYVIANMLNVIDCRVLDGKLVLDADTNVVCFDGNENHDVIGLLAMMSIAFYVPSTAYAATKYFSAKTNKDIDITFTPFYFCMVIVYNILIAAVRVFQSDAQLALSFIIALNGWMVLFTISYSHIFGSNPTPLHTILSLRVSTYIFPIIAAILQLSIDAEEENVSYAIILAALCLFVFIVCYSVGLYKAHMRNVKDGAVILRRADMITITTTLAKLPTLMPKSAFFDSWSLYEKGWTRKLKLLTRAPHPLCEKCNRANELAQMLVRLCDFVKQSAYNPTFLSQKDSWKTITGNVKTLQQVLEQAQELAAGIQGCQTFHIPHIAALQTKPSNTQSPIYGSTSSTPQIIPAMSPLPPPIYAADGQLIQPIPSAPPLTARSGGDEETIDPVTSPIIKID